MAWADSYALTFVGVTLVAAVLWRDCELQAGDWLQWTDGPEVATEKEHQEKSLYPVFVITDLSELSQGTSFTHSSQNTAETFSEILLRLAKCSIKNSASTYPLKELHEDFVLSDNHLTLYLFHSFQQASSEMIHLHWNYYVSFPVFHSIKDSVSIKSM